MIRVLAVFLFVWEPLRVAADWQSAYGTLGMRGPFAIAELIAHAVIAAVAVAAALALWNGNPGARPIASLAIAASAAASVQSLYATSLPHQTVPGERLPFAILAVAHATAWVVYLRATSSPPSRAS